MTKILKFIKWFYIQSEADAIEFLFIYQITDLKANKVEDYKIQVSISGALSANWGFAIWSSNPEKEYIGIRKILLYLAKEKIIEKLKEDTLTNKEELVLLSSNASVNRPFDPDKISDLIGQEIVIDIPEKALDAKIKENKLAASIIETRDRINAYFHSVHGEKLLLLTEERNLLDFFKNANSEEEFSHRIASLGHIARYLNIHILRKLTSESDTQIGSIILLNKYLESTGKNKKEICETLKYIGKMRQGYPIHTDLSDVIAGYKYFGLKYPIDDYEQTWIKLLGNYQSALKSLHDIFYEIYFMKSPK
jgi:hypothetical protein